MELSKKPSITSNGAMLGSFFVAFRGFFGDKIVYVPFVFLCRFDILRSTHRGNCAFSGWKMDTFSLYREKAGEEKEGERRLWERCVNRLRFSTVSIAAARARRFSHLGRSSNRNLDYFLDLFIQVLTL